MIERPMSCPFMECSNNSGRTNEFENSTFDQCAEELELNGYSLLPLTALRSHHQEDIPTLIKQAFATARRALDTLSYDITTSRAARIDPKSDSGGWTGYHNAASMNGRYNQHREGFVFSNGEMFDVETTSAEHPRSSFRNDMNQLFCIMHDEVATGILHALERRLNIPYLHFHNEFGPTNNSSQWHMKRYVVDVQHNSNSNEVAFVEDRRNIILPTTSQKREDEIYLPAHTDPSLISVVIIDHVGTSKGGMGLEVYHPCDTRTNNNGGRGEWREISQHGHDIAVIFVGSVFSYLTQGQIFPAAKHRVVRWGSSSNETIGNRVKDCVESRMAATLFVRPNGDAIMKPLPSPYLNISNDELQKHHPSFRVWNARVAKNYMKKKKQPHPQKYN